MMRRIDNLFKVLRSHHVVGFFVLFFGVALYFAPAFAFEGALARWSDKGAELYAILFILSGWQLLANPPAGLRGYNVLLAPLYFHLLVNVIRVVIGGGTALPLAGLYGLLLALLARWALGAAAHE